MAEARRSRDAIDLLSLANWSLSSLNPFARFMKGYRYQLLGPMDFAGEKRYVKFWQEVNLDNSGRAACLWEEAAATRENIGAQ